MWRILERFLEECRQGKRYTPSRLTCTSRLDVYVALLRRHQPETIARHVGHIVKVLDRVEVEVKGVHHAPATE